MLVFVRNDEKTVDLLRIESYLRALFIDCKTVFENESLVAQTILGDFAFYSNNNKLYVETNVSKNDTIRILKNLGYVFVGVEE